MQWLKISLIHVHWLLLLFQLLFDMVKDNRVGNGFDLKQLFLRRYQQLSQYITYKTYSMHWKALIPKIVTISEKHGLILKDAQVHKRYLNWGHSICNKNVWELPGGGTILQIEKRQKILNVLETMNWISAVNDLT